MAKSGHLEGLRKWEKRQNRSFNMLVRSVKEHEIVNFGLNSQELVGDVWSTQLREVLILFQDILGFSSARVRFFDPKSIISIASIPNLLGKSQVTVSMPFHSS
jgi:hypothetical protein